MVRDRASARAVERAGNLTEVAPTSPGAVPTTSPTVIPKVTPAAIPVREGQLWNRSSHRRCDSLPPDSADTPSGNRFNALRISAVYSRIDANTECAAAQCPAKDECVTDEGLLERRGRAHAHDEVSDSPTVLYLSIDALCGASICRPQSPSAMIHVGSVPRCIRHANTKVPLRLGDARVALSRCVIRPVPTFRRGSKAYVDQVGVAASKTLGASTPSVRRRKAGFEWPNPRAEPRERTRTDLGRHSGQDTEHQTRTCKCGPEGN